MIGIKAGARVWKILSKSGADVEEDGERPVDWTFEPEKLATWLNEPDTCPCRHGQDRPLRITVRDFRDFDEALVQPPLHSTMPRPGLPPLPHPSKWGQAFKRRAFLATRNGEREFYGRSILASPRIANQFVRALGIRKNEVIIESYPGPGVLTRALLAGGSSDPKVEQEQREAWRKEKANPTEVSKGLAEGFPQWLDYLTEADPPTGDLDGNENQRHKPKLVVSIEPTSSALRNGFGQDFADKVFPSVEAGTDSTIVQSAAEDRLVIAYNDPYTWQTFPAILEHPLVARNLPVFNSKSSEGPQVHRSFKDPEPPITFVATVPGHSSFDSFVSHLMNSSIGAGEGKPGYIWRYGRIRIALLCSKTLYDVSRPLSESLHTDNASASRQNQERPSPGNSRLWLEHYSI